MFFDSSFLSINFICLSCSLAAWKSSNGSLQQIPSMDLSILCGYLIGCYPSLNFKESTFEQMFIRRDSLLTFEIQRKRKIFKPFVCVNLCKSHSESTCKNNTKLSASIECSQSHQGWSSLLSISCVNPPKSHDPPISDASLNSQVQIRLSKCSLKRRFKRSVKKCPFKKVRLEYNKKHPDSVRTNSTIFVPVIGFLKFRTSNFEVLTFTKSESTIWNYRTVSSLPRIQYPML